MKKVIKLEIIFGLFALVLIYFVIVNNASITGFVISSATGITLVSPSDNTQTKETSIYFMFKYPVEIEMQECSLILNGYVARTTKAMLSPYDTRIRTDLVPGTYLWSIECIDVSNLKLVSETKYLVIGEEEESELRITSFLNRAGFIYEFELKQDLELNISNVVPNDVIRVRREDNTYDMSILRLIQDYSTGTELVDLLISPGNKRVRLNQGDSTSIDFNNDGQNDLNIVLNDISYRKALFTVSTKQEAEPKPPAIEEPGIVVSPVKERKEVKVKEQEPTQIPEQAQAGGLVELFFVGLIVVLIIAIISTARSRKKEEKKYITKLRKRTALKKPKKKAKKKKVVKKKAKKSKKKIKITRKKPAKKKTRRKKKK